MLGNKKLVNLHLADSISVTGLRSQIMYYNFDTKRWNRNLMYGYFEIDDEKTPNTAAVNQLKKEIERHPAVRDYSVAAVLVAVVAHDDKVPFSDLAVTPKWTGQWFGRFYAVDVLGNAVLRHRKTGDLAPFKDVWLRCGLDANTHAQLEGEAAYTKAPQLFLQRFYSAGDKFVHALAQQQKTK